MRGSRLTIIIIIVKSDRNEIESLKWATVVMRSDPSGRLRLPWIVYLQSLSWQMHLRSGLVAIKLECALRLVTAYRSIGRSTRRIQLREICVFGFERVWDRVAASAAKPVDGLAASIVWPAKSSGPRVEEYSWRCIRRAFNGFRSADVSVRYANICIYMHITAVFADAKGARSVSSLRISGVARYIRIFTLRISEIVDHLSQSVQILGEHFRRRSTRAQHSVFFFFHDLSNVRSIVRIVRMDVARLRKSTFASYIPILISVAEYPLFSREREIFRN